MASEMKIAIITGASEGIGASLVEGFRGIGYGVVANARSFAEIDTIRDPAVLAVEGDIAVASTAERIVSGAIERFGRIDTLVNNAGVFIPKPFTDYSDADFQKMTGVNLAGFFHMSQKAMAWMLRAGSGHVVNISATLAEQPVASIPAGLAALTKGGLIAVTRSLAIEYASRGIRVNAVSPGTIRTPMHAAESYKSLAGRQPMGRVGETQDVVDAVLYLERAAFVTGEIMHVDGGASAGCW